MTILLPVAAFEESGEIPDLDEPTGPNHPAPSSNSSSIGPTSHPRKRQKRSPTVKPPSQQTQSQSNALKNQQSPVVNTNASGEPPHFPSSSGSTAQPPPSVKPAQAPAPPATTPTATELASSTAVSQVPATQASATPADPLVTNEAAPQLTTSASHQTQKAPGNYSSQSLRDYYLDDNNSWLHSIIQTQPVLHLLPMLMNRTTNQITSNMVPEHRFCLLQMQPLNQALQLPTLNHPHKLPLEMVLNSQFSFLSTQESKYSALAKKLWESNQTGASTREHGKHYST